MKEKKDSKIKIALLGLVSILLISCGGGSGGGGGTSNLPIKPGNNISSTPKPNTQNNSTNKPNTQNSNSNSSSNNVIEDSPEIKFKNSLLENRKKSTESIPSDPKIVNGSTQKVAILDSDFLTNKALLENKYQGIEILDRDPVGSQPNTESHGEEVLEVMQKGTNLKPVAVSIGASGNTLSIIPKSSLYKKALERLSDQNVKVFNQSFGSVKTMNDSIFSSEVTRVGTLGAGNNDNYSEGRELLSFYKDAVENKNGLFVWAAGNKRTNGKLMMDASFQAGLPKFYRDLEKGWISAVGIRTEGKNGILNIHEESHLAYAGAAKWWSISADDRSEAIIKDGKKTYAIGSSYATPRVSRAAALVAEKFPWMTPDQVRQTLFTTTDRTEIPASTKEEHKRNIVREPDEKYGWGMLNQDRALKGPGSFINILSQYKNASNVNNIFQANIPNGTTSYFENDIYGDGGLKKLGAGSLHLTGNAFYERGSTISAGTLEVHKVHAGDIEVEKNGTLVLHSRALVGYAKNSDPYATFIDENSIKAEDIVKRDVINHGTVKISNNTTLVNAKEVKTTIIGGDYIADLESETQLNFESKVTVLGKIDINGSIVALSDRYVSDSESKILMSGASIEGEIKDVSTTGMKNVAATMSDGNLVVKLERENAKEYLGEAGEASRYAAASVEKVFEDLDQKIATGNITEEELAMGASMQQLSQKDFATATEILTGEIYASAQALTFSQSQNINRDLSNRMAAIDELKLNTGEAQTWVSAIGSDGKLRRDGYASADTRVIGGQFGIDKKISDEQTLGVALAYSYAKAEFNRYAGESKSDMVGLSLYIKKNLDNKFYTAGRLGLSHVSTKVNRELMTSTGSTVQGDIKHDDLMFSAYVEAGKKISWLNPFIGYSYDNLHRGSFSESNASWGIKADSKTYKNSNFLVGLRGEFDLDKYKLQTYISQAINVGKRDLAYEGQFTGNSTKQKFYGIKQAKNTTWLGIGLFRELNPSFGIYGNIDFRFEDGKKADSVFSTGLKIKF